MEADRGAKSLTIGFVGLGDQGTPMAMHLLDAGWPVVFFARRPEVVTRFRDLGAVPVGSLREVGERADLVSVVVVDDDDVRDVVLGDNLLAGMRAGTILAVHSTIHPDTCIELAALSAEQGVTFLDAPVSGGRRRSYAADLTVMVGGDEEAFRRAAPVFSAYATVVRRMGPVGSGEVTKLVNNFFLVAHQATATDAEAMLRGIGLDVQSAAEALATGSGATEAFRSRVLSGFAPSVHDKGPAYNLEVYKKDVSLMRALAQERGVDLGPTDDLVSHHLERMTRGLQETGELN